MNGQRVIVIDPGYDVIDGHHHALAKLFVDQAHKRGGEAIVIGHRRARGRGVGRHVLTMKPYSMGNTSDDITEWVRACNRQISDDLAQINIEALRPDDRIVVHTASAAFTSALVDWLGGLRQRGLTLKAHLNYIFPAAFWATDPGAVRAGDGLTLDAVRAMADSGLPISLSADTRAMADLLAQAWPGEIAVRVLPRAFPDPLPEKPAPPGDGATTFLFMGSMRPEKGAVVVAEWIRSFSAARPGVRLRLCTAHVPPVLEPIVRAADGVSVIDNGAADDSVYFRELVGADYVLCVYDPAPYRARRSGLVIEALAVGTPVLTTRGNDALEGFGATAAEAVEPIETFAAPALDAAIAAAVRNREARRNAARAVAHDLRTAADPEGWFDMMTGGGA